MEFVVVMVPRPGLIRRQAVRKVEAGGVHHDGLAEGEAVAQIILEAGIAGQEFGFAAQDFMADEAAVLDVADDAGEAVGGGFVGQESQAPGQGFEGALVQWQGVVGFSDGERIQRGRFFFMGLWVCLVQRP